MREIVNGFGVTRWRTVATLVSGLIVLLLPLSLAALTPLSQGYSTDKPIAVGSLVSVVANTTDQVEAATVSSVNNLIGVTINTGSSPISLSNRDADQVHVATGGTAQIIVSSLNGTIEQGDPITASAIPGVGIKATSNTKIIGIAQGEMSGASEEKLQTESGTTETVTIGTAPVLVSVASHYQDPDKTIIPAALHKIANSIAGKRVNNVPILISAGIFLITLVVVTVIIYSMIKGSIISVGRNPLAQSAVYRGVIQLSVLVLAILAAGLISIYFVLRLL